MEKSSKKLKTVEEEEIDSGSDEYFSMDDDDEDQDLLNQDSGEDDSENNEADMDEDENENEDEGEDEDGDSDSDGEDEDGDSDSDSDGGDDNDDGEEEEEDDKKPAEIKELEKEYMDLRHEEQDILKNLRRHKDEDLRKGEAVKNQRALWDKTLELRFLLQKGFSSSNRLPQEPVRTLFCESGDGVKEAYSDLIDSSKKTLDSMLELQEALLENNPSITQATDGNSKHLESSNSNEEVDGEWLQISQMHSRIASFRDKSVDKWQRKTQVTTGAAAIKGKLQAFNQNISEQVASYMRDPSRMIKGMQQIRSAVAIFGTDPASVGNNTEEVKNSEGDPELLDDSDFYQLLLKELFETHSASSETAFYALKRLQKKKRKIVDRRASKSRKIRYNVHEKIVNFMAPQTMDLPPTAPKLFEDLFGLKSHAPTSAA